MGMLVLGYCLREDLGIRWSIAIESSSLLNNEHKIQSRKLS